MRIRKKPREIALLYGNRASTFMRCRTGRNNVPQRRWKGRVMATKTERGAPVHVIQFEKF